MMSENCRTARDLIQGASKIAVLTGAGISTDSGIPDFRGPNGIWTLNPESERLSDIYYYRTDAAVRDASWFQYGSGWGDYEPNVGHLALARLFDSGKLLHIATQNIDRLHHASGIPTSLISELHGNREEVKCLDCGGVWGFAPIIKTCMVCDGLLKPNIVFFGENLNEGVLAAAREAAYDCDLYLVVGTSLQVWPAADLPGIARQKDTQVIYVNGEPLRRNRMERINCLGSISTILEEIIDTEPILR